MTRLNHTLEERVLILNLTENLISQGFIVSEACKLNNISLSSLYKWRQKYGGLTIDQVKKLESLSNEIGQLAYQQEKLIDKMSQIRSLGRSAR